MGSVPLRDQSSHLPLRAPSFFRVSLDFDSEFLCSIAMVLDWMSGGKRQVAPVVAV
jgi:hypothetical protein